MAVGGKKMARMSNHELNELLRTAVGSLQLDGLTLVTVEDDPTRPLLPEAYWQQQYDEAVERATLKTAWLFEQSLVIAQAKMRRRAEDERLANMSVDQLLDDSVGALWEPDELTSWGRLAMQYSGGRLAPPTVGDPQPSYDYRCYQCGRPITEQTPNHWVDHAARPHCDAVLMMADEPTSPYGWHLPTPYVEDEDE